MLQGVNKPHAHFLTPSLSSQLPPTMSPSKNNQPSLSTNASLAPTSTTFTMLQQQQSPANRSRRQHYKHLLVLTLFLLLLSPLFTILATANPQQPPAPQPGNGGNGGNGSTPTNNSVAPAGGGGEAARTDAGSKPTITPPAGEGNPSGTSTITEAPPQPTIITTVSVINGITTTVTITAAPPGAAPGGVPAGAAVPTVLPKAPQSIIIIQDTPYGKVLPAAGPADDVIESHFWDQYVPRGQGGSKSSAVRTTGVWGQVFSLFLVHVAALWTIAAAFGFA